MPIAPKTHTSPAPITCYGSIGVNGFDETVIQNVEESFELSPNYEPIYIVKDSSKNQVFLHDLSMSNQHGLNLYKSWIYDGTEQTQVVGRKYIQMYPYNPPILETGDYVSWNYRKDGIKSTWLVVALDSQTLYEEIGSIRQCTNEMRFYDESGALIRVPCVFDNKVNSEKNISRAEQKYINGITTVYMQLNEDSNKIHANQRFLFGRPGNWTSFRVVAVGVNNFMNEVYFDNESARLLEITMEASYVNADTDDIVNGIADVVSFEVSIDSADIFASIGDTRQLSALVYRDGELSNSGVIWSSSDSAVASVNSNGAVSFIADGTATITASMEGNESVSSSITVTVSSVVVDEYTLVISPYDDGYYGILQGDEITFSCYLYKNGIRQSDVVSFTHRATVPVANYSFAVVGPNEFKIKNLKMATSGQVEVTCTSGAISKVANIRLKGAW